MENEELMNELSPQMTQGYPLETLTPWMRNKVVDVCQTVKAAVPIAANLALSLIAACIARIVYVLTDSQREPTAIWTMSLAAPSERKTPVFDSMKNPIMESALFTRMICDITVPRYIQRQSEEHKLIGIDDEAALLDLLMQTNQISPHSFLSAYNETTFNYDRCKDGTLVLLRPSLTLGLAGQTDVFMRHYRSSQGQCLRDRGFFDRMLIVEVQALAGHRNFLTKSACASESISATYNECMSRLASIEQTVAAQETNGIELQLSTDADQRRLELLQEWEYGIIPNEDYNMISGWINKSGGLALRLAGILYMMDLVADGQELVVENLPPISEAVMGRAIRLLEYYRDQTIAWHNRAGDNRMNDAIEHLYQYMSNTCGQQEWSVRDLQQAMRNTRGLSNREDFDAALRALVDRGMVTCTSVPTGGRPTRRIRLLSTRGVA